MTNFKELGLSEEMLNVLANLKFETPTEIQQKAIPLGLAGKDVIGDSATGSGKTLAFGASIIEKLEKGKPAQALVLTPTRELAEQVAQNLHLFSKHKGVRVAVVYGGVGIAQQIYELERAEIIVATPGRMLDHIERRTVNFKNLKYLVLDEADRMLDMGFIEDVEEIIRSCPKERQTFLFSATISPDIAHIAKKYMVNPELVSAESHVDPSKLTQAYYDVSQELKFSLLVYLLKEEKEGLVMVFCNTRSSVDFIARNLQRYDMDALAIHGGLAQNRRSRILDKFHSGKALILICTDVAARGLDIKNVSHVYNYDIPNSPKEYVHRIGRTARAGKEGKAINLVTPRDYQNFRRVLEDDQLHVEALELPQLHDVRPHFEHKQGGGRSFGGGSGFRGGRGGGSRGGYGRSSGGSRGGGRSFGGRSGGSSYGSRSGGEGRSSGGEGSGSRGGREGGRSRYGGSGSGRYGNRQSAYRGRNSGRRRF